MTVLLPTIYQEGRAFYELPEGTVKRQKFRLENLKTICHGGRAMRCPVQFGYYDHTMTFSHFQNFMFAIREKCPLLDAGVYGGGPVKEHLSSSVANSQLTT